MSTSTTTTTDYYSTPGEILDEEFLQPLGISRYRLSKSIGVSETAIGEIVNGRRRITTAMAWRLSKALGTSPEFWANLQTDYDLLTFDSRSLGDIHPLVEA
ncbi:HigA family addiction module antidote protein [Bifidobacterium sp. CP2]|uniref:HigA family addiction module antitoxin n=1 Tax=Bifidobacterium sp. CP2 TaxID=2809025 RepID=UPI001BDC3BF2|nr:HigA family addiction module antitoxin [Bifidobacterium sp. CP2]MBT1181666.1 HigA family addiction module antidote protein [Bifidobacterium sp. CP2]